MGKVFIYNEAYPLYGKMYSMVRKEVKKCQKQKECELKIKQDVETYMKEYGKKVGTKIEESNFISNPSVNLSLKGNINYLKLTIIVGIVILGIYSIYRKNMSVGIVAGIGLALIFTNPGLLTSPSDTTSDNTEPDIAPDSGFN